MVSKWTRFGIVLFVLAAFALALSGCSGDDGGVGPTGPAGAAGATGLTGPAGADKTTGTVSAAQLSYDDLKNVALSGKILSVDTAGDKPVVTFQVVNKATNEGIRGLRSFSLHIAQLKPEAGGSNSYWQNYIADGLPLTAVPAFTERGATTQTAPVRPAADAVTVFNSSDGSVKAQGYSVVDNGDGTYAVTFGANIKANTKVTYDAALTHRVVVGVRSVAVPGVVGKTPGAYAGPVNPVTGDVLGSFTNTNGVNLTYDFIPATGMLKDSAGKQAYARDIVAIDACNECHYKLQYGSNNTSGHFGSRTDTKTCVMCHTPQNFLAADKANTLVDFTPYIHKIHMGKELPAVETNQWIDYSEIGYPQDIKNCVKCHKGADKNNWMEKPSRTACGSCHNNVDFSTGANHIGGRATNDSLCAVCHDAVAVAGYHVVLDKIGEAGRAGYPVNTAVDTPTPGFPAGQGPAVPTASQLGPMPAGVYKMGLEIKQVTVTGAAGAKKANVIYRITKDGTPVTLNAAGDLITGVVGSPSIYVTYAVAQDGIATPADWTTNISATVTQFRDNAVVGGGALSQTGPDASGYYTATFFAVIPDAAKMVTAALGINYQGFLQMNLPAYPKGIRLREPAFVMKTADGFTARRSIVSNAKCNSCHGQLGISPTFHGGARNNGEGCAICHNYSNSNATGHTGANYFYGGGWSVSSKDMIHSIHGSNKRTYAFNYEATAANPDGFKEVTYPGILKNCEQCHVAGSYDFRATANAAAVPNLLWSTAAKANMSAPAGYTNFIGLSEWINKLYPDATARNFAGAIGATTRANNLVISPISASCFGCHDNDNAVAHMKLNGGVIYGKITTDPVTGLASGVNPEACLVCHGVSSNSIFNTTVPDIKTVHRWW